MKGPFCANPFYTADHQAQKESDSCSKIRTSLASVARTLLSAAFELVHETNSAMACTPSDHRRDATYCSVTWVYPLPPGLLESRG